LPVAAYSRKVRRIIRRRYERQSNTDFSGAAVGNMGAGTKHSSRQHTFEHGFLANPEQPGNNSPNFFAQHNFAKHRQSQHEPARTDESEHELSGNFESDRNRRDGYGNRNLSELQPARRSHARHWLNGNGRR